MNYYLRAITEMNLNEYQVDANHHFLQDHTMISELNLAKDDTVYDVKITMMTGRKNNYLKVADFIPHAC